MYWKGCSLRIVGRVFGVAGNRPAAVIARDKMRTCPGVRHGEQRRGVWIGTAVVAESDGRRRGDFEVGDRSEADRGLRQKRGDAGVFAGISMWAAAAIIK